MSETHGHDYLIEFTVIGNSVKVTALDPVTQLEVSIVGDPRVGQHQLSRLAVRKLRYRLQKLSESN